MLEVNYSSECPENYYKGALAVDEGEMYHFYRQDSMGWWSHKDGGHHATDKDSKGKRIKNPRRSSRRNRRKKLRYKKFCGYYCIPKKRLNRRRSRKKGNKRR